MEEFVSLSDVIELLNNSSLSQIDYDLYSELYDDINSLSIEYVADSPVPLPTRGTAIEMPACVGDTVVVHSEDTSSLEAYTVTVVTIRLLDTMDGYTLNFKAVRQNDTNEVADVIEFTSADIGLGKKVLVHTKALYA